jgi:hypothetical protein
MDRLTFRRSFTLHTDRNLGIVEKRLANISQPPPLDPTPFATSVSVAVTHTANQTGLFEIHVMRGLPWGDHYSSMIAVGRITEEENGGAKISGEIHPAQQGLTVYSGVAVMLMLWVAATMISGTTSPVVSFIPAVVAAVAVGLVVLMLRTLYTNDLRQLTTVLEEAR